MHNLSDNHFNRINYIIGSGWWCSAMPDKEINPNRKVLGDDSIRSRNFFRVWRTALAECSCPAEIVVVDSASPTKPEETLMKTVKWIELPFNARHSTDHIGQWSGWTRSVLISGHYALIAESDYFVYVEQDCLLSGHGIIEHCISKMRRGMMFGSGAGTPQPIQQSFFIIKGTHLPGFLANLVNIRQRDSEFSPEWKFVVATCAPFVFCANQGLLKNKRMRRLVLWLAKKLLFERLPVGTGRARPIPNNAKYWYFQHGTAEEITEFQRASGDRASDGH